jgi:hypothetical protein
MAQPGRANCALKAEGFDFARMAQMSFKNFVRAIRAVCIIRNWSFHVISNRVH